MCHRQASPFFTSGVMDDAFTWRSNPLDWRPIDRFILLGLLVMLAPLLFGIALVVAMLVTPDYINFNVARPLILFYIFHVVLTGGYLGLALRRRRQEDDWPAFETSIIASFAVNILVSSFVTGTQYTEGLLIIFLGMNITSALANARKIYYGYICVCFVMAVFALIDCAGVLRPAPLLLQSLLKPGGAPIAGWLASQIIIAIILLAVSRISLAAVSRWVDRENLYREMSTIDGLTRLKNRRSFIERGQSELARMRRLTARTAANSFACIMLDLDHFKRINDTWGHSAGDKVLVVVSDILFRGARPYDEVGRFGGEEFAILLPGIALKEAAMIAERIRENIANAVIEVDGRHIAVSASMGVACYPAPDINDLNDLLKAADMALYAAKAGGRNQVISAEGCV